MLVDAHCHLDLEPLASELPSALAKARACGITDIVMGGVDVDGWDRQAHLAKAHAGLHPVYGVHPWIAATLSSERLDNKLQALRLRLQGETRPVAIGETGLDFAKFKSSTREAQMASLRAHLALAQEFSLPVVLHVVRAHGLMLEVLRELSPLQAGGMLHAYSGSAESAREYQALGLHISFALSVTNVRAKKLRNAVSAVSDGRLLVETDAPDQHLPTSSFGSPAELLDVVSEVAALRNQRVDHVASVTASNARKLFSMAP